MTTPLAFEDPRKTLLALLSASWLPANTPAVGTPTFASEWRGADERRPLITVTNRTDASLAPAGYSSILGDGSGVASRKRGYVLLSVWSSEIVLGTRATSTNPKDEADQMWREADRIILANFAGTGALEYLRLDGPESAVETDETGTVVRLSGRIDYEYELTPA